MEAATWTIAGATILYALTVLGTALFVTDQIRESRLLREAAVLKDAYEYVIRTHDARVTVREHADMIRAIRSEDDWLRIAGEPSKVDEAIHHVANCYHYIGFLMKNGLLTNVEAVALEAGRTALQMYEILEGVLRYRRLKDPDYKQYFDHLVREIRRHIR